MSELEMVAVDTNQTVVSVDTDNDNDIDIDIDIDNNNDIDNFDSDSSITTSPPAAIENNTQPFTAEFKAFIWKEVKAYWAWKDPMAAVGQLTDNNNCLTCEVQTTEGGVVHSYYSTKDSSLVLAASDRLIIEPNSFTKRDANNTIRPNTSIPKWDPNDWGTDQDTHTGDEEETSVRFDEDNNTIHVFGKFLPEINLDENCKETYWNGQSLTLAPGTYVIIASMGRGKSFTMAQAIKKFLEKNKHSLVLYPTNRRSLAAALTTELRKKGVPYVSHYEDKAGIPNFGAYIVQLESVAKIAQDAQPAVIVADEIQGTTAQFASEKTFKDGKSNETHSLLQKLHKGANFNIFMDADFEHYTNRSEQYVNNLSGNKATKIIHEGKPKQRTFIDCKNETTLTKHLIKALKEGLKVILVSNTASFIERTMETTKKHLPGTKSHAFYGTKRLKKNMDINKIAADVDLLAISAGSIGSGVSIEIEHMQREKESARGFDVCFAYGMANDETAPVRDFYQALSRVREVLRGLYFFCVKDAKSSKMNPKAKQQERQLMYCNREKVSIETAIQMMARDTRIQIMLMEHASDLINQEPEQLESFGITEYQSPERIMELFVCKGLLPTKKCLENVYYTEEERKQSTDHFMQILLDRLTNDGHRLYTLSDTKDESDCIAKKKNSDIIKEIVEAHAEPVQANSDWDADMPNQIKSWIVRLFPKINRELITCSEGDATYDVTTKFVKCLGMGGTTPPRVDDIVKHHRSLKLRFLSMEQLENNLRYHITMKKLNGCLVHISTECHILFFQALQKVWKITPENPHCIEPEEHEAQQRIQAAKQLVPTLQKFGNGTEFNKYLQGLMNHFEAKGVLTGLVKKRIMQGKRKIQRWEVKYYHLLELADLMGIELKDAHLLKDEDLAQRTNDWDSLRNTSQGPQQPLDEPLDEILSTVQKSELHISEKEANKKRKHADAGSETFSTEDPKKKAPRVRQRTIGGGLFFELQLGKNWCLVHALNNGLGGKYFEPADLETASGMNRTEDFSIVDFRVLAGIDVFNSGPSIGLSTLGQKGFHAFTFAPTEGAPGTYEKLIDECHNTETLQCFVACWNTTATSSTGRNVLSNGHFTALKKTESGYWDLDSMKARGAQKHTENLSPTAHFHSGQKQRECLAPTVIAIFQGLDSRNAINDKLYKIRRKARQDAKQAQTKRRKARQDAKQAQTQQQQPPCIIDIDSASRGGGGASNKTVAMRKNNATSAKGLYNYGNTCFISAILQVLLASPLPDVLSPPLPDVLSTLATTEKHPGEPGWLQQILLQLADAYKSSEKFPKGRHSALEDLAKNVCCLGEFKCGRQEDACEFFNAVLNVLSSDGQNKRVEAIFAGESVSELCCKKCGNRRFRPDERFVDLKLDVVGLNSVKEGLSKLTSIEPLATEAECVECTKTLSEEGCDECPATKLCPTTKKISISKAPSSNLCIQLKRFDSNNSKMSNRITFPLKLDLTEYVTEGKEDSVGNTKYELFALVVHIGDSIAQGHYTSYVKRGNIWFCCDDDRVSEVSEDEVLKQNPYMIFYQAAQENNRKATDISAIKIAAQTPASAKRIRMKKENQNPQETKKFSPRSNKEINLAIPPKSIVRPTTSLRRRMSFQKVKRLFSCAISFAGRKGEKVSPRDDDCYGNSDSNSHSNSNKPSVRRSDRLRVNTKKKNDENTRIGTYSPIRFSEYSQWEQQRSYNHSHSLSSPLKRLHSADHIFGSEGGDNKRTMKKARILRSTTTDGSGSSKRTSKRTVRLR